VSRATRDAKRTQRAIDADRRRSRRDFARNGLQAPLIPHVTRLARPAQHTAHQASSAHVQAAYPAIADPGLGSRGVYIGELLRGGPFVYDPWVFYDAHYLTNANTLCIGIPGYGKSALVKTYCLRQYLFGRVNEFIDPKGEYGPLVQALGGVTLRLEPGGRTRLNPISRVGTEAMRTSLLEAIARAMLGRPLHQHEAVGLGGALRAADDASDAAEICIPDVVTQLRQPTTDAATHLGMTVDEARNGLRECMLALVRLCEGPLRGMFDGPTTAGEQIWNSPSVSIDLSAMSSEATADHLPLAITMVCASAFLDAKRRERKRAAEAAGRTSQKVVRANDEGWKALPIAGLGEYYQAGFKLSRDTGVQHLLVLHRLSDLSAAGDQGSRQQKLAEGLLSEAETKIVYRQAPNAVESTADLLGLTGAARDRIGRYAKGVALWIVGSRTFEVQHVYTDDEWPLMQTDQAMTMRGAR
jgi:hypothetical protein